MTAPAASRAARPPQAGALRPASLARNVAANWLWYGVVLLAGFILPRLIDAYRGQVLLGVWDFGWSLVFYVSALSFGVTSGVNRYVARLRATNDLPGLNVLVSSSLALLLACAALGLLVAAGLAAAAPRLLAGHAPQVVDTAGWTILLLCGSAAVQLPAGVFNGVITGHERFDVLNGIRIARDLLGLGAMLALLLGGFGLVALALTVLAGELAALVAKWIAARRLCPTLCVTLRHCRAGTMRELLGFGGKTFAQAMATSGAYQGSGLLVAVLLGPAALAVYARQRALIVHTQRFVKQYAQVFVPRSSALQASADDAALRRTLIDTARYGLYITLPIMLVLLIMGGPVLHVWMGPGYVAPAVLATMAAGHLLSVSQLGVYSLLMGLGRHGRPALFDACAAVASLGAGLIILGPLDGGLVGAALAMTAPVTVSAGVVLPLYACRTLGLPVRRYARQVFPGPLLACLPLAACLLAARIGLADEPQLALLSGLAFGGALTAAVYARWVLPAPHRRRASLLAQRLLGRAPLAQRAPA